MLFCKKCGSMIDEGAAFCSKCGTPVTERQTVNVQRPVQTCYIDTTGTMVWAIINMFLCWPISIYSILTLNKVNKAVSQDEGERYFKSARTSCVIATIIGIVVIFIALASSK